MDIIAQITSELIDNLLKADKKDIICITSMAVYDRKTLRHTMRMGKL